MTVVRSTVNPEHDKLCFQVFDHNRVTRDDFLGMVELPLKGLQIPGVSLRFTARSECVLYMSTAICRIQLSVCQRGLGLNTVFHTPLTASRVDELAVSDTRSSCGTRQTTRGFHKSRA